MKTNLEDSIKLQDSHPRIEKSVIDMITNCYLPFYGEFALFLSYYKSEKVPTCGVNVSNRGIARFFWNQEFMDKQTLATTNFLIIHEDLHLLLDHIERSVGYDQRFSNLVQDMIINQIIYEEIIVKGRDEVRKKVKMPLDEVGNNSGVFIPKRYKGEESFNQLYKWVKKDFERWENGENIVEEGEQTNIINGDYGKYARVVKDSQGNEYHPEMYALHQRYQNIKDSKGMTLDTHLDDSDCDKTMKKQAISRIVSSLQNRGLTEGNEVLNVLRRLKENKKDHLKYIKRNITNEIMQGKKGKSITRPNRKEIQGIKGKRKYRQKINAILDSSGSMNGYFDKILSFIFQNDISINLIQIDGDIQDIIEIKDKSQLNKMDIKGLGGTVLTPAFKKISQDKYLNKYNTVVLTDGMTDSLDLTGVKGNVLVISHEQECPIEKTNGKLKQILVKDE